MSHLDQYCLCADGKNDCLWWADIHGVRQIHRPWTLKCGDLRAIDSAKGAHARGRLDVAYAQNVVCGECQHFCQNAQRVPRRLLAPRRATRLMDSIQRGGLWKR